MKKRHRDITVDGVKYGWTLNSHGKERYIKVWKDKKPILTKTFRQQSVTPKDVEELIRENL